MLHVVMKYDPSLAVVLKIQVYMDMCCHMSFKREKDKTWDQSSFIIIKDHVTLFDQGETRESD